MKKVLWALPLVVLFAALGRAETTACTACPSKVEGAKISVENTADGVVIRIAAKDAAAVKKIQETAAEHFKKEASGKCAACKKGGKPCAECAAAGKGAKHMHKAGWACPMGCAHADKPGKCPKCGMDMKPGAEKKK